MQSAEPKANQPWGMNPDADIVGDTRGTTDTQELHRAGGSDVGCARPCGISHRA